jgi:ubiquinone/menaquinone biosynthesis C-methylase UbiE
MKNVNTPMYWDEVYENEGFSDPCMRNDTFVFTSLLSKVKNRIDKLQVLDAGCGNGYFLKLASLTKNWDLYGIDHSKEGLEVAKKRVPQALFKQGDLHKLPYLDNFFDVVFSMETLEHIHKVKPVIDEMKRVLVSGGQLLIQVPYKDDVPSKEHINQFDTENLGDWVNEEDNEAEFFIIKHTGRTKIEKDGMVSPVNFIICSWIKK